MVCRASEEGDAEALATFFRESEWDLSATADNVRGGRLESAATNLSELGVPLPAWLAVQGNRVIGYCGSLPLRLWNGTDELNMYWAKGLMVLPEFRNGPIGFHVLKELSRSVQRMAAVTVQPASKRLFSAIGYRDLGALPNLIKPLSFAGILRNADSARLREARVPAFAAAGVAFAQRVHVARALGWALDLPMRFVMPGVGRAFELNSAAHLGIEEIDELWRRVRPELSAGSVRDGRAIVSRYGDGESNPLYRFGTVRRDGRLVAFGIVRRPRVDGDPRLAGIKVASLSDLLVAPSDTAAIHAAFSVSEQGALAAGAQAVICSASSALLAPIFRRRGYIPFGGTVHFFLRSPAEDVWPSALGDWWLTRGDSDSDGNF